jgi:hypothetical protein
MADLATLQSKNRNRPSFFVSRSNSALAASTCTNHSLDGVVCLAAEKLACAGAANKLSCVNHGAPA